MTKEPFLLPVVAAALVDAHGRVLVQQRAAGKHHAGLWEFPGGKIEHDETPEAALVRELGEELAITVDPADLSPMDFAGAPHGDRHLLLLLYRVARWADEPQAIDAAAVAWRTPEELAALPMPPADRVFAGRLNRRRDA